MLNFYAPWNTSTEETKVLYTTFNNTLTEYIWDEEFLWSILLSILQYQMNTITSVDMEEADDRVIRDAYNNDGNE